MREYDIEVFGRRVLRAAVPDEVVSEVLALDWTIYRDAERDVLCAPEDVHNWVKGEVIIRERSKLLLPDLEIRTSEGVIELYLDELQHERSKIVDFQKYRLQKNAMAILEALEHLEDLLHQKAQLVKQEEELLKAMKIKGYDPEEIAQYEEKVNKHREALARDFEKLADSYPRIRESANLLTLKNLLALLDDLQENDPAEYLEVKEVLKEAVVDYFANCESA